jgi:small-conductance mechanosensitive channel
MRAEQAEFQAALAQARALAAVAAPLQQQAALLQRFSEDMQGWQRTIASATRQVLRGVGVNLLRLMIAIGVVLLGAALWRMATLRYVTEPSRRRLLLTVRRIVVLTAVVLVVVVHFASELTTLVTALGFAAAGVAFALQTVILAVAGYVSMMAPNGIRVGDHVSLQGPFGYVHGEVIDIGFVRIRLRELAGDPLRPTGRTVVFPNSVVFTGSFFKHPPGAAPEPPELHRAA